jgi:hypothetical protein
VEENLLGGRCYDHIFAIFANFRRKIGAFKNQIFSFAMKNALAYSNAGVVVVN